MKKFNFLSFLSVFTFAIFFGCSSSVEEKGVTIEQQAPRDAVNESDSVYTVVDIMPVFSGGESELLKHIFDNVVYPEAAKKVGMQGKSIVRFCVSADGSVNKVSILKGSSPELDTEAVRVISNLPAFESPAYKDGKPVSVWYVVPIYFRLN